MTNDDILVPKLQLGNLAIPQTMVFTIPGAAWRWPQVSVPKPELENEAPRRCLAV